MRIRVMIHLDCGHIEAKSIEPADIPTTLATRSHVCARCSWWGSAQVTQSTKVFTLVADAS